MAKTSAAPNTEILEAALQGLESQKQKIDEQIAQVRSLMGRRVGRPPKQSGGSSSGNSTASKSASSAGGGGTTRKKRVLSAEARKRIAAAQKKRWAAFRKTQE